MPPRRHTYIAPPRDLYLHTSTSLHLQRASRALEANFKSEQQSSMLPRLHASSARPAFHISTSLGLQRVFRPLELHTYTFATPTTRLQGFMPPYIHVATPAASLHISRRQFFYIYTPAAKLEHSSSARLQRDSDASHLDAPHLDAPRLARQCAPPEPHASTSLQA